jgi:SAM-dependent methyltransferase
MFGRNGDGKNKDGSDRSLVGSHSHAHEEKHTRSHIFDSKKKLNLTGIEHPDFWKNVSADSEKFRQTMMSCVSYAFTDVTPNRISAVVDKIVDPETGAKSLEQLGEMLYDWHTKLATDDIIGYATTHAEHMESKTALTTDPIEALLPSKPVQLYDVGTGDGQLTGDVVQRLEDLGFEIQGSRIDIDDGIDWTGSNAAVKESGGIQKIQYAGDNLGQVIQQDLKAKKADTSAVVVTYNHSLHHWPSPTAQAQSIQQLGAVLKEGALVVLKEHFNIMDDDVISLNHALINFRFNLFKYGGKKGQRSYQVDNPKAAGKLIKDYVDHAGEHNYMSPFWLAEMMKRNGFELVAFTPEKAGDTDRTVAYAFRKKTPSQHVHKAQAFDDLYADSLLRELKRAELTPRDTLGKWLIEFGRNGSVRFYRSDTSSSTEATPSPSSSISSPTPPPLVKTSPKGGRLTRTETAPESKTNLKPIDARRKTPFDGDI